MNVETTLLVKTVNLAVRENLCQLLLQKIQRDFASCFSAAIAHHVLLIHCTECKGSVLVSAQIVSLTVSLVKSISKDKQRTAGYLGEVGTLQRYRI